MWCHGECVDISRDIQWKNIGNQQWVVGVQRGRCEKGVYRSTWNGGYPTFQTTLMNWWISGNLQESWGLEMDDMGMGQIRVTKHGFFLVMLSYHKIPSWLWRWTGWTSRMSCPEWAIHGDPAGYPLSTILYTWCIAVDLRWSPNFFFIPYYSILYYTLW